MSYKVLVADEAASDIFELVRYIQTEFSDPDAAGRLYHNLNREVENIGDFPLKFSETGIKYRGHTIHKKVYGSYLIFYIFSIEKQEVYVLRVIKDSMDWQNILDKRDNIFPFLGYND